MAGFVQPCRRLIPGFVVAIAAAVFLAGPLFLQTAPAQEPAVIDVHAHLVGQRGARGVQEPDFYGAAEAALSAMDRFGVKKTFLMPPPFTHLQSYRYPAEDFLPAIEGHPDRFGFLAGGGTLNVMIQEAVEAGKVSPDLRRAFEQRARQIPAKGAVGFGEMAAEHFSFRYDHPYEWAPSDHPLFLLLADIAADYGLPIDIHMEAAPKAMALPGWLASPPNPKRIKPNIAAFERLLAHNRKAKIIWSHIGWDNTGFRTVELTRRLLKSHPNLFMSFKFGRRSVTQTRAMIKGQGIKPEWLALIVEFPDRFFIGSDQFHLAPGTQKRFPRGLKPATDFLKLLPPDLARKIGRENPKRVFGMGEQEQ